MGARSRVDFGMVIGRSELITVVVVIVDGGRRSEA